MRRLQSITNSMDMNLSKLLEMMEGTGAWHALYMMCSVHGVTESQMRLNNNNTDVFGINAITCVMLAICPTFPVFSLDPAFLPSIGLLRS